MHTERPTEEDRTSVDAARRAADTDELARWVRSFLASPGSDNADLGTQLAEDMASWAGPVQVPFDELNRLAGPPDQPTMARLGEDDRDTVTSMVESLEAGWEPPPLIATIDGGRLALEDGNHRVEALRRAGHDHYWTIVGGPEADDADRWIDERALRRPRP